MSSIFPGPSLSFPLLANVLDASEGESSTPLMDGQEILSSLTDLVPGATPVLGWSTYHGMYKVSGPGQRQAGCGVCCDGWAGGGSGLC